MPGVEIYVAAKSHNKLSSAYNEMGEALYYATPRSLFRTFFYNGELFARGLYKNNEQLKNLLNTAGAGVLGDEIIKDIFSFSGKEFDKQISDALEKLKVHVGSGTLSQKDFEKIQKLIDQSKHFQRLTSIFSMPARTRNAIEEWTKNIFGERLKKMREGIVNTIMKNEGLKNLITKTLGEGLLKEFAEKGGLRNLIKPLVKAALAGLGIALTPIGSILVTIGTNIAMDLVGKIAKVLVQVILVVIVGLIAGIFILFSSIGSWRKWNKKTYSYNYVVPDTVNQCEAYEFGPISPDPVPYPGDPVPVPDIDCGPGDTYQDMFEEAKKFVSAKYKNVMNIGLVWEGGSCPPNYWCHASTDGVVTCVLDCIVTHNASCDYFYRLSIHELAHKVQLGCGSSEMREWGADYISGNAGGYTFYMRDGSCKKATEIGASGCGYQELEKVALCLPGYSTSCHKAISDQIVNYTGCR
jgi:hypothetical protein